MAGLNKTRAHWGLLRNEAERVVLAVNSGRRLQSVSSVAIVFDYCNCVRDNPRQEENVYETFNCYHCS